MFEINKWIEFRKELHKYPELSGNEEKTSKKIYDTLEKFSPDELYNKLGGNGIMATFFCSQPDEAETLLFRAELDAIAVQEESGAAHASRKEGIMHGCGHDGHMTILLGLAEYLHHNPPRNYNISLLFQPAEETGKGAAELLKDPLFEGKTFKRAFALHNLPGFEENRVIIRKGVFAAASVGLEIALHGRSSHAAYPEQGSNPSHVAGNLLTFISEGFEEFRKGGSVNKIVCTYAQMGNIAYGISPGRAQIGVTIRSSDDHELQKVSEQIRYHADAAAELFDGTLSIKQVEPFSATINDDAGTKLVETVAGRCGFDIQILDEPFPWSEDFGEFRKKCPVTLFGLGTGKNHPPLHSEMYDFNDRLIEAGIELFAGLSTL